MNHCSRFYASMRKTTGAPPMISAELMPGDYLVEAKDGSFRKEIDAHCGWCAKTKACEIWADREEKV